MQDAPEIFTWEELSKWKDFIESFLSSRELAILKASIRESRNDFLYPDDPTAFEKLYEGFACSENLECYDELIDGLTTHFQSTFNFIRMYHACRPTDLNSYYENGIRVLDFDDANRQFKADINLHFPEVKDKDLQAAFDERSSSHERHNHAYFALDKRFLVKHGKAYYQSGSEYLRSLAAIILRRTGVSLYDYLQSRGQPRIFEVKISTQDINFQDIVELQENILCAWAFEIAHKTSNPFQIDFTISLQKCLSPQYFVDDFIN